MLLGHEKVDMLHLPTPIEYLPAISKDLGINLYIKRDDLTPLAMGGNKLRKLEYLLKDAQNQGATMLLTAGGAQTNHGRLTCAVARKYGLKGAIVAVDKYPGELSANLLLDGIMGSDVYLKELKEDGPTEAELFEELRQYVTEKEEANGEKVYFIPIGGSNEIGALGYYECALEITKQVEEMGIENPRVVSAIGSMGTYIGLAAAQIEEKLPIRVTGVEISPHAVEVRQGACNYFNRLKDKFGLKSEVTPEDFDATSEYHRGGYNNPVKEVREAMYYMAEKEAIILDPCYTGKAFAGLMEMVKSGKIAQGENVIFVHTGGSPGISTPFHRTEIEAERDKYMHIL